MAVSRCAGATPVPLHAALAVALICLACDTEIGVSAPARPVHLAGPFAFAGLLRGRNRRQAAWPFALKLAMRDSRSDEAA